MRLNSLKGNVMFKCKLCNHPPFRSDGAVYRHLHKDHDTEIKGKTPLSQFYTQIDKGSATPRKTSKSESESVTLPSSVQPPFFQCTICDEISVNERGVQAHIKKTHKQSPEGNYKKTNKHPDEQVIKRYLYQQAWGQKQRDKKSAKLLKKTAKDNKREPVIEEIMHSEIRKDAIVLTIKLAIPIEFGLPHLLTE